MVFDPVVLGSLVVVVSVVVDSLVVQDVVSAVEAVPVGSLVVLVVPGAVVVGRVEAVVVVWPYVVGLRVLSVAVVCQRLTPVNLYCLEYLVSLKVKFIGRL